MNSSLTTHTTRTWTKWITKAIKGTIKDTTQTSINTIHTSILIKWCHLSSTQVKNSSSSISPSSLANISNWTPTASSQLASSSSHHLLPPSKLTHQPARERGVGSKRTRLLLMWREWSPHSAELSRLLIELWISTVCSKVRLSMNSQRCTSTFKGLKTLLPQQRSSIESKKAWIVFAWLCYQYQNYH